MVRSSAAGSVATFRPCYKVGIASRRSRQRTSSAQGTIRRTVAVRANLRAALQRRSSPRPRIRRSRRTPPSSRDAGSRTARSRGSPPAASPLAPAFCARATATLPAARLWKRGERNRPAVLAGRPVATPAAPSSEGGGSVVDAGSGRKATGRRHELRAVASAVRSRRRRAPRRPQRRRVRAARG